jgi:hypothetical protein
MNRTKELPNTTNSPHTRTVLPPRTTGKKITRPDTSFHELSKQALEYSNKASQWSQEAHRKSEKSTGKP